VSRGARLWLPALLREVADRFGEDTALTLARDLGGRFFTLPSKPRAEHPIAASAGEAVLAFLIERYGALERVTIPKGPDLERLRRLMTLRRMVAQGATANAIAAATGMHVRWVYAQRAKLAADAAQPDLFAREEA
jgi:hypothetical protein